MSTKIKLSRPIPDGENTITDLELREPSVADVGDLGYPFVLNVTDGEIRIELKPKVILKYASRLGDVPPSTINSLSFGDFSVVQEAVMGFFGQVAEAPPTALTPKT